jgi:hypothetical protein
MAIALTCALTTGAAAQAASVTPDVIFGSGNANGSFTVGTGVYEIPNTPEDQFPVVELGLRGKLRFDDNNQPQNTFNYDGVDTYTFRAGTPPTGFGFAPNSPTTPVWNFEWSINSDSQFLGLPFPGLTSLNALTYELRLDGDPTAGTNFGIFDPINVPFADHAIGLTTTVNGGGAVASDATEYASLINTRQVAQNSWSYEFFNDGPAALGALSLFDPNVAGTYRIELEAFSGGVSVAETGINIEVAPIPLPAAGWMLLSGLGALAAMRKRAARA